jgi:hypothetical protein
MNGSCQDVHALLDKYEEEAHISSGRVMEMCLIDAENRKGELLVF